MNKSSLKFIFEFSSKILSSYRHKFHFNNQLLRTIYILSYSETLETWKFCFPSSKNCPLFLFFSLFYLFWIREIR